MGDRSGNPRDARDIRDRLGARTEEGAGTSAPPKTTANRPDTMAAHKTTGATCESCGKPGHMIAQCWSAYPELVPESLMKKRQVAMSATDCKRRKAVEYASPNYHFQGMALTYRRPHYAMVQRRSTRPSVPTEAARESVEQQPTRRVQFAPSTPATLPGSTPEMVDPLCPTSDSQPATPGFESDNYAFKGHLPQSFPRGLSTSSLEPGNFPRPTFSLTHRWETAR